MEEVAEQKEREWEDRLEEEPDIDIDQWAWMREVRLVNAA